MITKVKIVNIQLKQFAIVQFISKKTIYQIFITWFYKKASLRKKIP